MAKTNDADPAWDYTHQAEYYEYRPNYERTAIVEMLARAGIVSEEQLVADVGAGTANLTLLLLAEGCRCVAIEPNDAMRSIGQRRTAGQRVSWLVGTGERTGLNERSVDLFAMGSSFNTTDRAATLREAHRVLRPGRHFACRWHHRDVEGDAVQARVESILRELFAGYQPGTRREDQTALLGSAEGFSDLTYIERTQQVRQTRDRYVAAWRSVKNRFWDIGTEVGAAAFARFEAALMAELPEVIEITYSTRIWMIRAD